MINIKRDGSIVKINVQTDLRHESGGTSSYPFSFNCGDTAYADLLERYLKDRLSSEMKKARQEAYEKGWREAKAKVKKETWFNGSL